MAKPRPTLPPLFEKIEELTPITSPERVDQRPAGVAGIDGRVGLDHVEVEAGLLPVGRMFRPVALTTPAVTRRLGVAEAGTP